MSRAGGWARRCPRQYDGGSSPSAALHPNPLQPVRGAAVSGLPGKVPSDRPPQLQFISRHQHLGEVGRHRAIVQPVHRKHEPLVLRGGGYGVASLGLVAIGGGQPHVDMLAGLVPLPVGNVEHQTLGSRGLGHHLNHVREAPGKPTRLYGHHASPPSSAALARGLRSCGSPKTPRNRGCRGPLNSSHVHFLGLSTSPTMEKSHSSRGVWGVGPAERTGKPSSRYWPGGRAVSWLLRRPLKPREKNPSPMSYTSLLSRLYSSALRPAAVASSSWDSPLPPTHQGLSAARLRRFVARTASL